MLNQILKELKEIKKLLKVIVGNQEQDENFQLKKNSGSGIKELLNRDQFGNLL